MGQQVCRAVLAAPDLELVAAVDPALVGIDLRQVVGVDANGTQIDGDLEALAREGAQVAVNFTLVDAARENLRWCAGNAVHAVIGTSGFSAGDVEQLRRQFGGPGHGAPNAVLAANFAIGAVLMMRFAELAARFMDGAEVIELHHDGKRDAPSGTAIRTAERMAEARRQAGADPFPPDRTEDEVLAGARGAEGPGGVRIHSVRLPGMVAHQEIVFGAEGQSLSLRHDAYDRSSFMAGVLLAVRSVADRPGFTEGLESLLGF